MKTSQQITKEFLEDLTNLLRKYNASYPAEISCEDHFSGYAECGEDVRMTVTIPSIYDEKGNQIREYTEIDLGKNFPWFNAK